MVTLYSVNSIVTLLKQIECLIAYLSLRKLPLQTPICRPIIICYNTSNTLDELIAESQN